MPTPYGATKWPRLVTRIAEAGSVAGRGCSPSPQDMPDAQHVLVLPVAGWVNRPCASRIPNSLAESRIEATLRRGTVSRQPQWTAGGRRAAETTGGA